MATFKGKTSYNDAREVAAKLRDGICLMCGSELDYEYCCKAQGCGKDWLKLACRVGLVKDSDKDQVQGADPGQLIWKPGDRVQ